ncbi:MAG: preQ(1) synthase [Bdellovibrionales bacterium]|nr:preQ(1) synthase [Bdellovibrionales bacterium]
MGESAPREDVSFLPPFQGADAVRDDLLETFPFHSPKQRIETETAEFSAVCPFSGLPDYAKLKITYYPTGGKCVELRSLKYYITSFRNVGIYQEEATALIRKHLELTLECPVQVETRYNTRGGFDTLCTEGQVSVPS